MVAGEKVIRVTLIAIDRIAPYDKNPRLNDDAVDAVAASIEEFGFRQPVVVDTDHVIIVGHTRWKAAKKLGLEKVPVHVARDLSDDQIRAYRIADNQTNELSEWDLELLPLELAELQAANYDLGLLAFDQESLAQMLDAGDRTGLTDPDDIPAPPAEATTQPGDLWILGDHRLLCGDSSHSEDVDRLIAGQQIDLINMDPPYNVKVEPRSNNAKAAGKQLRARDRPLANDFVTEEAFNALLDAWFGNAARVLKPGGSFYIWGGYSNVDNYPPSLKASDLYFSQVIVWDKQHPSLTRKDFMGNHEFAFYGWRCGAGHRFFGPTNATDLWQIKKVSPQTMIHLTEKPVELAVRAIEYSSKPGEHVLDFFGGSGSTLIGCEQTRRHGFLMEIDPLYCDVIVERWQNFTGRKAEREPAGSTSAT